MRRAVDHPDQIPHSFLCLDAHGFFRIWRYVISTATRGKRLYELNDWTRKRLTARYHHRLRRAPAEPGGSVVPTAPAAAEDGTADVPAAPASGAPNATGFSAADARAAGVAAHGSGAMTRWARREQRERRA